MFQISQVIYNLQRYGNCKVYFYEPAFGNTNVNDVVEFKIETNGELQVRSTMEVYRDIPRWDGKSLNCVNPIDSITVILDDKLKLKTRIAAIISSEIYGNPVVVTTTEKLDVFKSPKEEIEEVYDIATKMLSNWNSRDFSEITFGGLNKLLSVLLLKANQQIERECYYRYEYASELLDDKMKTFLSKADTVRNVFEKLNNIVLSDEEPDTNVSR